MERNLFSEKLWIYSTSSKTPNTFRVTMKMRDEVNGEILEKTFRTTIKRYPYFAVRIVFKDGEYCFEDNEMPIPVLHTDEPVELGGAQANGHLMVLSWWKDTISVNVYLGLTGEEGVYQFIKTLLYYYSSKFYASSFSSCRIRFTGSQIPDEEWNDPLCSNIDAADDSREEEIQAFQLADIPYESGKCLFRSIRVPEKEFLEFSQAAGCKPAISAAAILAKAVSKEKTGDRPVVIGLCEDLRGVLEAKEAHQNINGEILLQLTSPSGDLTVEKIAASFAENASKQESRDKLLSKAAKLQNIIKGLDKCESEDKKRTFLSELISRKSDAVTCTVSFRGMADYDDAEQFVKGFSVIAPPFISGCSSPLQLSVCDMNGFFYFNLSRFYESGNVMDHFVNEFESLGLSCEIVSDESIILPLIAEF